MMFNRFFKRQNGYPVPNFPGLSYPDVFFAIFETAPILAAGRV